MTVKKIKAVPAVIISAALLLSACGGSKYASYEVGNNFSDSSDYGNETYEADSDDEVQSTDTVYVQNSDDSQEESGGVNTSPLPASQLNVDDFNGNFYKTQTLKDDETGLEVCEVMVPNGWTASLSLNWSAQSTVSPVVAAFTLASADGNLVIAGFSTQSYVYNYQQLTWGASAGTVLQEHGDDEEIPSQRSYSLSYRTAADFVPWYLGKRGMSVSLISERDINQETFARLQQATLESYNEGLQTAQNMYSQVGLTLEGLGCDCSMLDARYQGSLNGNTVYLDVLSAGDGASTVVHDATADYYSTGWDNLYVFYMAAPTMELLDENRDLFETVFSNSKFSEDFAKLKASWGAELNDKIAANNLELLEEITSYWVEQHLSSSVANSTQAEYTVNMWDEVINSTDTYSTLDGSSFTASSIYTDSVYQNGAEFYVAPSGSADYPPGWKQLEKRY